MGNDQKRILLAVVLSAAIIFGWQLLFPSQKQVMPGNVANETSMSSPKVVPTAESTIAASKTEATSSPSTYQTNDFLLQNGDLSLKISSDLAISDFANDDAEVSFTEIVGTSKPFKIQVLEKDSFKEVYFALNKISENEISGDAINFPISFYGKLDDQGKFIFNLTSRSHYKFKIIFNSTPKELENNQIRNFVYLSDELNTVAVGKDESEEKSLKWFGIDFNYHVFLMILNSNNLFKVDITEGKTDGNMQLTCAQPTNAIGGSFVFLRKDYNKLTAMGDNLDLAVDFGMWSILAVPILHSLQFFYGMIPNYGIDIILITLILRLLTFPLQYKSIKSMNKMKELQPQLKSIKEKYKDDQQRVQKETMELFKKSGYNPMGGCLPIILQIPIFFAFYRVLYNAVELVGAPFFGWISDLSMKDPYYILPVLMGISFFLQQKFTPTPTADKAQQKMMMFMPLIFVFVMKDLPSGLTLYIFVSTIFGILQQVLMSRKKKA